MPRANKVPKPVQNVQAVHSLDLVRGPFKTLIDQSLLKTIKDADGTSTFPEFSRVETLVR